MQQAFSLMVGQRTGVSLDRGVGAQKEQSVERPLILKFRLCDRAVTSAAGTHDPSRSV